MNHRLSMVIMCVVLSVACISVNAQQTRCKSNRDQLYDRSRVLQELADILNKSIPEYSRAVKKGFYTESERALGFFVVDLTNPKNKEMRWNDCIDFIEGHIYHVAPPDAHYSLSHIVILEGGELKVFRSVNCPERGDRIEDVISYVNTKLANDKNREQILNRLRNYRKYGSYFELNHAQFICKHGEQTRVKQ